MVIAIEPPAIAYCIAPNPSNGLTTSDRAPSAKRRSNAFSFSKATPAGATAPERIRGNQWRFGGGEAGSIRERSSNDTLRAVPAEALGKAPIEATDQLRVQLRDRGYLTHGIERWFALDPWSSRAFWIELTIVAAKAAALIALFAALPPVAIMLARNHPLTAGETLLMTVLYGATAFVASAVFIVVVALVMKLRPELVVDTPRALLAISFLASAVLALPLAFWWSRFDARPSVPELAIGGALIVIFFVISTIVVSAALLSFSVYELQRIPAIHQKPRTVPMAIAAAILLALLFIPAYAAQEKRAAEEPLQVVTTPTMRRIALVEIGRAHV